MITTITTQVTMGEATSPPATTPENPPTQAAPALGDCSPEAFARDVNPEFDVTLYRDGQWARTDKDQTDWVVYAYWDGGQWIQHPADGITTTGMSQNCYDLNLARTNGAPEEPLSMMPACD